MSSVRHKCRSPWVGSLLTRCCASTLRHQHKRLDGLTHCQLRPLHLQVQRRPCSPRRWACRGQLRACTVSNSPSRLLRRHSHTTSYQTPNIKQRKERRTTGEPLAVGRLWQWPSSCCSRDLWRAHSPTMRRRCPSRPRPCLRLLRHQHLPPSPPRLNLLWLPSARRGSPWC